MPNTNNKIYEDEIDLVELFKTIWSQKVFILFFTFFVTSLSIFYVFSKTPIYEVKSNIQIGFIGVGEKRELLDDPSSIVKKLNIIFNVEDKIPNKGIFTSIVTSITQNKNSNNFLEIKTEGISNDDALAKNKEVLLHLQNLYQAKLDLKKRNVHNSIKEINRSIDNINKLEIKNIEHELNIIEQQKLSKIDKQIMIIKKQDIPKLEKEIDNINMQQIAKIDEDIKFLNDQLLLSINNKIKFHTQKLQEYTNSVSNIAENMKNNTDSSSITISSIQMVNYQNLILNSQNKVEDLETEKATILTEKIPSLLRKKENLKEINIRDINMKIKNLKNITLVDLEKQKQNIINDELRKLKYDLNTTVTNKKKNLEEQIKDYEYMLTKNYMQNSFLIGNYVVYDYPTKPKKKLTIVVSFVTGFILSIFLVFFIDFFRKSISSL